MRSTAAILSRRAVRGFTLVEVLMALIVLSIGLLGIAALYLETQVVHALKAYASFATFPMMSGYLDGVCASGLNEARLGCEEFKKEVHTFSAAYREKEIKSILKYSDSVIFNSFYQLEQYGKAAQKGGVQIGLRVNPGHAEVTTDMYNPCAPYSRLGIVHALFKREFPRWKSIVDGLHFHVMCQQNADVLERVTEVIR